MTAADLSLGLLAVAAFALIAVVVRRPEAAATPAAGPPTARMKLAIGGGHVPSVPGGANTLGRRNSPSVEGGGSGVSVGRLAPNPR